MLKAEISAILRLAIDNGLIEGRQTRALGCLSFSHSFRFYGSERRTQADPQVLDSVDGQSFGEPQGWSQLLEMGTSRRVYGLADFEGDTSTNAFRAMAESSTIHTEL